VVSEGGDRFPLRVEAWKRHFNVPRLPWASFIDVPIQLLDRNKVDELIALCLAADPVPALIVIDTLARSFVGFDENGPKDMGRLVDAASRIQLATGATVMLVHHTPKGRDELRGHSSLLGALDTSIFVKRDKARRLVQVICKKQKDLDEFEIIAFRERDVDLGDGETSKVLEHVPPSAYPPQPRVRLERAVLQGRHYS
jgi:hypothetical protein